MQEKRRDPFRKMRVLPGLGGLCCNADHRDYRVMIIDRNIDSLSCTRIILVAVHLYGLSTLRCFSSDFVEHTDTLRIRRRGDFPLRTDKINIVSAHIMYGIHHLLRQTVPYQTLHVLSFLLFFLFSCL